MSLKSPKELRDKQKEASCNRHHTMILNSHLSLILDWKDGNQNTPSERDLHHTWGKTVEQIS
jgi:plasmid maintenance system killer protein